MNNYNKSRCYAIARRWLILVVLAFTALLIFSLLFPAYHYSIEKAIIYLDRFPNIIKIGIALSLVFMLFLFIYWMGGIRKRDFYSVELWPPIWKWAIIITLIYIFFIDEFLKSYQFIPSKREWTILTILVLLTLINWPVAIIYSIMTKIYSKRLSPNAPEQQQIDKLENFNDVIEWLEVEKPINMPEEDRFNMAVIARRIARILCEKPLKSIGQKIILKDYLILKK